jgi:acetyl-CoA acetyltransferase
MATGAVISGVGHSEFAMKLKRTAASLMGDALAHALSEAKLAKAAIDGVIVQGGLDYDVIGFDFGIEARYSLQTWAHGRMTGPAIMTAAAVIDAGLATHVLCIHARSGVTQFGGHNDKESSREGGGAHGEVPYYGITAPASAAALSWRRYTHLYHADPDALKHVVVNQRRNATLNPHAVLRDKPLDEAGYLAERIIIEPLRRADFALPNDGAAAVIVSRASEASHGVPIVGAQGLATGRSEAVFAIPGMGLAYQDEPWDYRPAPVYAAAGIEPKDVDLVSIYDSFSPSIPMELERYGHCPIGKAWSWMTADRLAPDGELPVNTSGGHIAESGLSGWNHIIELYRQLRGQCGARQVRNARFGQYISPNGCSLILGAAR